MKLLQSIWVDCSINVKCFQYGCTTCWQKWMNWCVSETSNKKSISQKVVQCCSLMFLQWTKRHHCLVFADSTTKFKFSAQPKDSSAVYDSKTHVEWKLLNKFDKQKKNSLKFGNKIDCIVSKNIITWLPNTSWSFQCQIYMHRYSKMRNQRPHQWQHFICN